MYNPGRTPKLQQRQQLSAAAFRVLVFLRIVFGHFHFRTVLFLGNWRQQGFLAIKTHLHNLHTVQARVSTWNTHGMQSSSSSNLAYPLKHLIDILARLG